MKYRILFIFIFMAGAPLGAQYLPPIAPQNPSFVYPSRGISGDLYADTILGQIDFSDITANQAVSNNVGKVSGILVDALHNRLFAYDSEDSRVYVFNDITEFQPNNTAYTGYAADAILGQPDFVRTGCNWDGNQQDTTDPSVAVPTAPTAFSLCSVPQNVTSLQEVGSYANMAVDPQGNLYVPDVWNERVLRYNAPFTTGQAAVAVWGQADFSSNASNRGQALPSADSFFFTRIPGTRNGFHAGVGVDAQGNLWVADIGNYRVLRFPNLGGPGGVPSAAADLVLGQPDFTTMGNGTFSVTDTTQLRCPIGVRVDASNNVYVIDSPQDNQSRMVVYQNPVTNNTPASYAVTQYLLDPADIELDAPSPIGTGGIWVSDAGEDAVINFLNGVAQKVLFRDSFAAVTQYAGAAVAEPGVVGDNGPISYLYPPGDYNTSYFMGYVSGIGVDSAGGVYAAGGTQWNDVWRFPGPIPYPTSGAAHSADVEVLKPTQKLIQNFMGDWGMYQPEGVAVGWGLGPCNPSRQIIVATETRLMFWNLPDGSVTGLSNGQTVSGIAGTNAPFERALPGFDGYSPGTSYQRIREDKDITQQHLYAVASDSQNPDQSINEIFVFNLPLTANAAAVTLLRSPTAVLGGGALTWSDPEGVATDPEDPTGATLWIADGTGDRVFRIRNPLTNPQVDIILGQTNTTSTTCNSGGTLSGSCSDNHPTASTLNFPGAVAMDHHGDLYVSDDSFESNGNYRMLRWDAAQLPTTQTSCQFAIPATFVYGTVGNSPTIFGGNTSVTDDVSAPTEPGFTSDDQYMVVGGLFDVFPQVLSNPRQGEFPLSHLKDYSSQPYASTFDDQNNYYVVDANRNRLLIYRQPFVVPTPTSIAACIPTVTVTSSPTETTTLTPTPSPAQTSTPTLTSTQTPTPSPTVTSALSGPPRLFPNPCRDSGPLHVRLGLALPTHAKIKIFTTAFRKVAETPEQLVPAGQDMIFYPVDDKNSPLANGLYYLEVQATQQRFIFKMLVLR